eukprot:gnl/TRDRNA2_/TRDRNA2_92256_c0_seq1.p1 gnl/TRDRNA2_/TRDRNA2_92256_c0~~gnl/TRDRNA2_/TRDRNA2_92256_c0_seq1.p1  ORF type:complete len:371 (+),score=75.26 gnl/TRDRNA2_/TRDRNA2_92256_c0_seq1:49-1161(+)
MGDNLYITGLPEGFTDEACKAVFGAYGTVLSTKVLASLAGSPAALVRFSSPDEATWIINNLNGNIPMGLQAPINVKLADNGTGPSNGGFGKAMGKGDGFRAAPYGGGSGGGGGSGAGRTKTVLCNFFEATGNCRNGAACTFAHGVQELGMPRDGSGGAGGAAGAGGAGGGGNDAAMMAFMAMMMTAMGDGGEPDMNQMTAMMQGMMASQQSGAGAAATASAGKGLGKGGGGGGGKKTQLCKYFEEKGYCRSGENCTYAHGAAEIGMPRLGAGAMGPVKNVKTQMCKFWMESGTCSRGPACTYAHGQHEIGMPRGAGADDWGGGAAGGAFVDFGSAGANGGATPVSTALDMAAAGAAPTMSFDEIMKAAMS